MSVQHRIIHSQGNSRGIRKNTACYMLFLIKVMIQIILIIFMPHHRIINVSSRYSQPELVFRIDGSKGIFI